MANVCFYDLVARGEQNNVYKFLYLLQSEMHMTKELLEKDDYQIRVFGQCRWSVTTGLIEEAELPALSRKFGIEVEVFGVDPGYPDELEHFHYKNGNGVLVRPSSFHEDDLDEIKELLPEIQLDEYEYVDEMYMLKDEYRTEYDLNIDNERINAQFEMDFGQ